MTLTTSSNRHPQTPLVAPYASDPVYAVKTNKGKAHFLADLLKTGDDPNLSDLSKSKQNEIFNYSRQAFDDLASLKVSPEKMGKLFKFFVESNRGQNINCFLGSKSFQTVPTLDLTQAFSYAVSHRYVDLIRSLAPRNYNSRFKEVPANDLVNVLFSAAEKGHSDVVKTLIENGCLKEIPPDRLGFVLSYAAAWSGHRDVVEALIESGRFEEVPPHYLSEALCRAALKGHSDVVEALIESGRFKEVSAKDLGGTFSYAAEKGHSDVVEALIESGRFKEVHPDHLIDALFGATRNGHSDVVKVLIERGRFAEIEAEWIERAIRIATEGNHKEIVARLQPALDRQKAESSLDKSSPDRK